MTEHAKRVSVYLPTSYTAADVYSRDLEVHSMRRDNHLITDPCNNLQINIAIVITQLQEAKNSRYI